MRFPDYKITSASNGWIVSASLREDPLNCGFANELYVAETIETLQKIVRELCDRDRAKSKE